MENEPDEVEEKDTVETVEETPQPQKGPVPAPIESPKGLGWFSGTSWGA